MPFLISPHIHVGDQCPDPGVVVIKNQVCLPVFFIYFHPKVVLELE